MKASAYLRANAFGIAYLAKANVALSVTMTIVKMSDTSDGKVAECRNICDGIGVPLRVRQYLS